jgi:hypothetical protein
MNITNAYVKVAWTVASDLRDKTDIENVPHGLDFVHKLEHTGYTYQIGKKIKRQIDHYLMVLKEHSLILDLIAQDSKL